MRQFLGLVVFELSFYLKRISTYVFFGVFLGIALFFMAIIGGAIPGVNAGVGGSGGNVFVNSPHVVFALTTVLSLFGLMVVSAVSGNAVYRDFHAGIHPLVFTTPVGKWKLLASRYIGSALVNTFILSSVPLGLAVGQFLPALDAERLGPFSLATYAWPLVVTVLPNVLFAGAIFFTLAGLTRQMLPNYVGGVVLLVGYLLAGSLGSDLDNQTLAALIDPFGMNAYGLVVKYWTPAERNGQLVPLEGLLLANRMIWLGVGALVFGIGGAFFRFRHLAVEPRLRRAVPEAAPRRDAATLEVPAGTRSFGARARLLQFASTARTSTVRLIGNKYFAAIAAAGITFVLFSATQVGKMFGTTTWPVTYQVVELLGGTFGLFILIVITYLSGELVWEERDLHVAQVHDALPVPAWVPFLGKFTALCLAVALLQAALLACCVLTQAVHGYFHFELGLQVRYLLGVQFVSYLQFVALAFFVHAVVNQKYVGHLVLVLIYATSLFAGLLGLEHNMLQYASSPGMTYSDMNHFGPFVRPWAWFNVWWGFVAMLLAVIASLAWPRGTDDSWRSRLALLRLRMTSVTTGLGAIAVLGAVLSGGFVFWNTNILNDYRTSLDGETLSVRYERDYKQYQHLPQPRITGQRIEADIFPGTPALDLRGTYQLKNETTEAVTAVHVLVSEEADIRRMEFSRPVAKVTSDKELGYHIHELAAPLAPGETMTLDFSLHYEGTGFTNDSPPTSVVENGTFFNSGLAPSLGYAAGGELGDDEIRRKHDLAPKPRMASIDDMQARRNTYVTRDSDWIDFDITVSTDPDQTAIAPGYLQREWTADGRRYFHYTMDSPILGFWSVLSARYDVKRDDWNGVAIEIWYHPGHEYNVDRMIKAVKDSLDYYTTNFGPYQHRQVRILEFPRYADFAQSFPNTIPYSESIGFIARLDEPDDIDYVYYVTAHEVAHQWFAHQIIGGNVQGATVLSETLSQYGALMVMEREYGREHVGRFLEYELDSYLTGRAFERKKEMPLLLVENQQYIHYRKGSVITYGLRDYIGEAQFNTAIRALLERTRFQGPPYPTSADLLAELRKVTPREFQYLLDDGFVNITLYDNRVKEARLRKLDGGKWAVSLDIEAKKFQADGKGEESEVPMDDLVEIGVFAEGDTSRTTDDLPLHLEKHVIHAGSSTLELIVDKKPVRAGIDPRHLLIDRHSDDNTVKLKEVDADNAS